MEKVFLRRKVFSRTLHKRDLREAKKNFHTLIRLEVHFSETRKEFNLAANLSGLESALTGQDSRTILLHDLLHC